MSSSTPQRGAFELGLEALHERAHKLQSFPYVTLSTLASSCELAISFGAKLYNEGQSHQCYRLYLEAARQLLRASDRMEREAITPQTLVALEDLRRAEQRASEQEKASHGAWMMRHSFDKIMIMHQLQMETLQWMLRLAEASFTRGDYQGSVDALRTGVEVCPALWTWDDDPQDQPEESPEDEDDSAPQSTTVQAAHLAYLYYGNGLFLCGDFDQAASAIRRAFTLSHALVSLPLDLRTLGVHYDAFVKRRQELEQAPSLEPETQSFLQAYLAHYTKDAYTARELLTMHLVKHPHDEAAHILLALSAPTDSPTRAD